MRIRLKSILAACVLATSPAATGTSLAQTPVTVTVTKSDCIRLVKHQPDPGVTYQPGVDAFGRPVVPADLGGRADFPLPETFEIEIEVDLQERFGVPANRALFDADADLGTVVVARDGRAFFNGAALHNEAVAALIGRCQAIFYGRTER